MLTCDLRCGDWRTVLADVTCDLLAVDAPYSAKTHAGHDAGAGIPPSAAARGGYVRSNGKTDPPIARRMLDYGFLTPEDVAEFVASWLPRTRGWMVSITDDVLAPVWAQAMRDAGRYVFAPLPFVAPGSRVRLTGDGPSNWTCWIVVGRPKTRAFASWGTLPGAYVLPPGQSEAMDVVGGKPLWLMRQLVLHYSRPGDVVVDAFAGGATTLIAARLEGRNSIGAELSADTYAKASARLALPWTPSLWHAEPVAVQEGLFDAR